MGTRGNNVTDPKNAPCLGPFSLSLRDVGIGAHPQCSASGLHLEGCQVSNHLQTVQLDVPQQRWLVGQFCRSGT